MPTENIETLDQEWFHLIREAQQIGLSIEEIEQFLNNPNLLVEN
ncbi:anti-repressor SinI family protein [Bacillus manliponensis]